MSQQYNDPSTARLIIENKTDRSHADALGYVSAVIAGGRISGDSYCFCTVFENNVTGENVVVYATRNAQSDKFVVCYG